MSFAARPPSPTPQGPDADDPIPVGVAPPATSRELLAVAIGLVILVSAQLVLTNSESLLARHYWFDEMATQTLVADASLLHSMQALQGGCDCAPPTLYLLLHLATFGGRFANEVVLRSASLGFALLGLLGMYASLRLSFSKAASLAGMLFVWNHPLFLAQAFEARFYAPWFAGTVWFSHLLCRSRQRQGLFQNAMLGAAAVILCTVHYFGVVTLALTTVMEILVRPGVPRGRFAGMLPVVLGPVVLLACLPFLLGQRAALTEATWMSPIDHYQVEAFLGSLFLTPDFVVVVLVGWLCIVASSRSRAVVTAASVANPSCQAGLTALLALPIVLIVFSYAVVPVIVGRYALPAIAGLAVTIAYAASRLTRYWILVLCVFFVLASSRELRQQAIKYRVRDARWDQMILTVRDNTADQPVVFERALNLWVLPRYAPDLQSRCYLLDFETTEGFDLKPGWVFIRDVMRRHAHFYRNPPLARWSELRTRPRFYLYFDHEGVADRDPAATYPGFTARLISGKLYEMYAVKPANPTPGIGSGR